MYDPETIKVRAATLTIDTVEQFYVEVGDREKPDALARVLEAERPDQAIIFARTKIGVDRLAHGAERQGRAREGAARRHVAGLARRRDARVQGRARAAARGHRRGRARARHLGRHARRQLRHPELARRLRAPHRPHRPRGPLGPRDHADHAEAAARAGGDRDATRRPRSTSGRERRAPAARAPADQGRADRRSPETRRPRHTKPRSPSEERRAEAVRVGRPRTGARAGATWWARSSTTPHLEGEDITHVRVLERFSFVEVPAERAKPK